MLIAGGLAGLATIALASWRTRPFEPKVIPASVGATPSAALVPVEIAEEVAAHEVLRKLARPTVDLLAWSNDPDVREDDCALVVPPPRPGDVVRVRPGAGCRVISVNGQRVEPDAANAPFAFPPFRPGLNWIRVETTLGRSVLGFAEVPADRKCGELADASTPEEIQAYEQLRHVLYPPATSPGADRVGAMKVLHDLPEGQDRAIRRFGRAWIDLCCGLHELGHGTEMSALAAMQGQPIWSRPETRSLSRAYLDEVQALIKLHPNRERLWLGLGWQLRWGQAWDAARASFSHALALNPKSGWSWFEVARWEREMVALENRRDPRTKDMLEDQSLQHFRLALRHIAGGSGPGLQSVIDIANANIRDLEARHARHHH